MGWSRWRWSGGYAAHDEAGTGADLSNMMRSGRAVRIPAVCRGRQQSRALYAGAGERRVHRHGVAGEEETAYVDQHLVPRNGKLPTKHISRGRRGLRARSTQTLMVNADLSQLLGAQF
ncbi:uncharacterized protein SOCE26_096170 [Sorangium cellulosum]|uniref:Uncharacterized protein n=1 Tax=Sorangium cellulosum TaxID=56 RepID=A0A2L0F9G8_SORCE|nr:uncharacterized protein SOCE26_096170 [Sorangium cellulosum]